MTHLETLRMYLGSLFLAGLIFLGLSLGFYGPEGVSFVGFDPFQESTPSAFNAGEPSLNPLGYIHEGIYHPDLMKVGRYQTTSYKIRGQRYAPKAVFEPYVEVGKASWYGPGFHGQKTANGEYFDMHTISAAHKTLQLPCIVKVTNLDNNKKLVVRINDRGPFHGDKGNDRIIDLSYAAAQKLGFSKDGLANVRVEVLPEPSMALAAACLGKKVGAFRSQLNQDRA